MLQPNGIKLITRLKFDLSHLYEDKFRRNLQENHNPIRSSGEDKETTIHYLLHCPNFLEEGRALLDNLQSTGGNIHVTDDSQISELLLFDVSSNNDASNTCIIHVECYYPIHVSY